MRSQLMTTSADPLKEGVFYYNMSFPSYQILRQDGRTEERSFTTAVSHRILYSVEWSGVGQGVKWPSSNHMFIGSIPRQKRSINAPFTIYYIYSAVIPGLNPV